MNCYLQDKSCLNTLEWLVDRGYFQNNLKMILSSWWSSIPLFQVISSMTHLVKLSLLKCNLTLTEDVPQLLRLCPKLTELHLSLSESQKLEMDEDLKNELRPSFQRLRIVELKWDINSLPLIQEIFT
jgi:hypothetical protein